MYAEPHIFDTAMAKISKRRQEERMMNREFVPRGMKGVKWNAPKQKWEARLEVDGERLHVSWHKSVEAAAEAYAHAVRIYYASIQRNATQRTPGLQERI